MVFATQLSGIKLLDGFIIDSGNRVAVSEDFVSVNIGIEFEDRSFAQAATLQKYRAARDLRILFVPSESPQERHA
jgi:hypothetical protein